MHTETVLLLLMSAIAASGMVLLQYYYRAKGIGKLRLYLSLLRFTALFCLLLLLVNPKWTKTEYRLEKTHLVLLVDNSSSMADTGAERVRELIFDDPGLAENFNIHEFQFSTGLGPLDSLDFKGNGTNINEALASVGKIFGGDDTALLLVSDGNQTLGSDYIFHKFPENTAVMPIVMGDTTRYEDILISNANTNRYAFLKNKFPLETFISYQGDNTVSKRVRISLNGQTVANENVQLSPNKNTSILHTELQPNKVGVQSLVISVEPLENERNIANNKRELAIEVLDERTMVAIVTDLMHPDLGALKKSIEQNEQRSVAILSPQADVSQLEGIDLFILYQPNPRFKSVQNYILDRNVNTLSIFGTKTDWDFVNGVQGSLEMEGSGQTEEISPILQTGTSLFDVSGFSTKNFPPLQGFLGEILIKIPHETLIGQSIMGVATAEPLLSVSTAEGRREAFLFGEGIWKWRMQCFRNDGDHGNFDDFIGQLMLYLSASRAKERLELEYRPLMSGTEAPIIKARYFDATFIFDPNATITLALQREGWRTEIPFLSRNGYYEVDLMDLKPGDYSFTVQVAGETIKKEGRFKLTDFDVEKQLQSSDYRKMERLAANGNGKLYFPADMEGLIADLKREDRFRPTQIGSKNVVPLIDFKILLAIIIAALAGEWFLRKFNGLT